jgi:L-ascorbate metabolism protein UlaG (beta-lactamase superfamily)
MIIRYLGHSSFFLTSPKGAAVVIDPYSDYVPFSFPNLEADVVVVSHEHRDHNAIRRVQGTPVVVKRTADFPVEHEVPIKRTGETLKFMGLPTFHDNFGGRRRGPNTVWHFFWDGVHFVHLGDLGHLLTDQQVQQLGKADVLFLPVGGKSTLGPAEAGLVINQLNPNLVFPMHFQTPGLEDLALCDTPLEAFLSRMARVEDQATTAYEVDQAKLPMQTTIILLRA